MSLPPLIAHLVYRFDVGGLENGVVNLVNGIDPKVARHAIVSLTEVTSFSDRITTPGVELIALGHKGGQTLKLLPRLVSTLRKLNVSLTHSRNIATLEGQLAATLAGVPHRLHGEHGWDIGDLSGENRRNLFIRKLFKVFTHRQIALSQQATRYLTDQVGVSENRTHRICNGVDVGKFVPQRNALLKWPKMEPIGVLFGTVGRCSPVKNQGLLLDAFLALKQSHPAFANAARLVIVGAGLELASFRQKVKLAKSEESVWLVGEREDIKTVLPWFDVFVLPSLSEGISNAILEAMACGVPVIASDVGGNSELVSNDTGALFPNQDIEALKTLMLEAFLNRDQWKKKGTNSREIAVSKFSLNFMIREYTRVYSGMLNNNL
jgi:sugar transferase (PEP-CTERM/EpsH1 system associated)